MYSVSERRSPTYFVLCIVSVKDVVQVKFEDTKAIMRSRKSKKDRQINGQKKEDKRTNNVLHYTENLRPNNANLSKTRELTRVLQKR